MEQYFLYKSVTFEDILLRTFSVVGRETVKWSVLGTGIIQGTRATYQAIMLRQP